MFPWLDKAVYELLNLVNIDHLSPFGISIHFFIYDTIQITFLLIIMIFFISYIRSYFPPERTKKILENFKGILGNFFGSTLGVISPFCSCSSIPIFIGLISSGIPLGITFSFLITSPIVNEAAIVMLFGYFDFRIALLYISFGILIGVIGGFIIDKLHLEEYVEGFVYNIKSKNIVIPKMSQKERLGFSKQETQDILKRVYKWIIVGVFVGSIIHGWVPQDYLVNIAGPDNPFAVIIVTILAVPLYSNVLGTIPVANALIDKGMGIGTAMSFMMATTALSLPEMMILRKVMKPKLIWIFIGITTIGIIIIGYSFNLIIGGM
ncbi:MAG: permease [Candidatus Izimaplasma sp.]|nr:permease [Candidatus Izimaplasma bacterium]